mgnify:CR=1 FL=1
MDGWMDALTDSWLDDWIDARLAAMDGHGWMDRWNNGLVCDY